GNFSFSGNYPTGYRPLRIALGDFNEDTYPDIVTTNEDQTISILLGDGNGGFGTKNDIFVGNVSYVVLVEDFNGDGHKDLAVTVYYEDSVAILLGNGSGTFGNPMKFAAGGT